jgi:hypothetical protein
MRRALRIIGWCIGTVVVLFIGLLLLSWRYTQFFPKVWSATITVDGKPSPGSSLYRNRWTGRGLFARRSTDGWELYAFGRGDESGFVWGCEAGSFSVVPGLALSNHEQFAQGCVFRNPVLQDSAGGPLAEPKKSVQRDQRMSAHMLEFTADDGERVRTEW